LSLLQTGSKVLAVGSFHRTLLDGEDELEDNLWEEMGKELFKYINYLLKSSVLLV